MIDWNDPAARFHLADSVGTDEYNRLFHEHVKSDTVAIVNGWRIRPTGSRFGTIFLVVGADVGYSTQAEAEAHAGRLAPKDEDGHYLCCNNIGLRHQPGCPKEPEPRHSA